MENWTFVTDSDTGQVSLRAIDFEGVEWWIPEMPGNRHYEEYLEWVSEGNTPEVIND
jgi:hypothetical protein